MEEGHPCKAEVTEGVGAYARFATCGKTDDVKPMAFRGTNWCSDEHRKLLAQQGDSTATINGEA
jgi:hypothetical protein